MAGPILLGQLFRSIASRYYASIELLLLFRYGKMELTPILEIGRKYIHRLQYHLTKATHVITPICTRSFQRFPEANMSESTAEHQTNPCQPDFALTVLNSKPL